MFRLVLHPRLLNFPRYQNGYDNKRISSMLRTMEKGTIVIVCITRLRVEKINRRKSL